jgi:hypothetical protein
MYLGIHSLESRSLAEVDDIADDYQFAGRAFPRGRIRRTPLRHGCGPAHCFISRRMVGREYWIPSEMLSKR